MEGFLVLWGGGEGSRERDVDWWVWFGLDWFGGWWEGIAR